MDETASTSDVREVVIRGDATGFAQGFGSARRTGAGRTAALGFLGKGGTLTISGIFVNRCTWAHALAPGARMLGLAREHLLTATELAVLDSRVAPESVII